MHSLGFPLLVDAAVKGTLVLLAATAATMLLRRRSAANRHLVWQLALMAMLTLPVIKVVSPWQLPVLPQLRSPVVMTPSAQVPAPAQRSLNTAEARQKAVAPIDNAARLPAVQQQPATSAHTPQTPLTLRVLYWLGVLWLALAAALLIRLLLGFALVRWFALRAYPLYEDGWSELNSDLAALAGVRNTVQVYASPHIATPMTWGFRHPVIMLPSAAEDWTVERRRVVLLHEMAHIRRRDSLTHFFAQLACALYWFHPLVWQAAARMRAEAERASDDLVLQAGTKASVYADHLLELIRTIGNIRTPALALPMAQRSTFEGRLLAILEPHLDRTSPRPLSVLGMIVVLGLIIFPLAGLTTASAINTQGSRITEDETQITDKRVAERNVSKHDRLTDQITHSVLATMFGKSDNKADIDKAELKAEVRQDAQLDQGRQERISPAAVASLINALRDSDSDVRLAAVQALGQAEDSGSVAALSRALRTDTDARVRKMAAWALGQIEDRAAVPALADALRDSDAEVRQTAVWALGQIEDRSAVPALLQALKSNDVDIRREAAWALGQIEDASAVPGLAAVLHDQDADLRQQAVWALGQIESPQAVEPLTSLSNDPDPETREQVAWALGQIENASAVTTLSNMLRSDKVEGVRKQAAWALGQIENSSAVPALSAALKDPSEGVRAQAAWALGQIEQRPAPQELVDALKDSSQRVRSMALWALTQIGDPRATVALAEMLKDPNPEVRREAAAALGGRSHPMPMPMPRPKPRPRPMN